MTETWLKSDILTTELELTGFSLPIRKDRNGRRGGGCIIYVKEGLNVKEVNQIGESNETESIWMSIYNNTGEETILGVCYRHCILVGDFNHRTIDWDIAEAEARDQAFLDTVQDCFLTQHVRQPTRGDNILDLIFSSEEKMVEEVRILPPLANSDHNAISFRMKIEATVSTAPDNESQDFNGADWGKIRRGLSDVKWNDLLTVDVQQNIDTFTQVLQDKSSARVYHDAGKEEERDVCG